MCWDVNFAGTVARVMNCNIDAAIGFVFKVTEKVLRADFMYRADRLIPCVQLTYAVLSTSPWRGLSALELLMRGRLWLRVYSE